MSEQDRYKHQKNYEQRQREAGRTQVKVFVPEDRVGELKEIARTMRDEADNKRLG